MSGSSLPFSTLLFDLDGTLIDSARDVTAAVNVVLAKHGLATVDDETGRTLMGEGGRVRMRKAFAMRGHKLGEEDLTAVTREFIDAYALEPVLHTRPYDGVRAVLEELARAGVRLAVCTNKYEGSARDILGRLGLLPLLDDVAGADSFDVRKPHPGHLLKLLDRMGATAAGAAMIGDSLHDIHAARAAGLPSVAVSWGYTDTPPTELGADAVIGSFAELPAALQAIAAGTRSTAGA